MKIAFFRVPFTAAQRSELESIASGFGCCVDWYPDDARLDAAMLTGYDALLGYFPPDVVYALPKLKWLQVPSAGVEKYCRQEYASPEALLTNCSGAFGTAIAEYILCGILMLYRRMPEYFRSQEHREWKNAGTCRSISGSVITVVGMGDIGTAFAEKAHAMGAVVRGVRRSRKPSPACFDQVYTSECLEEAVKGADAVVLCIPGTAETTGMISRKVLLSMNVGAVTVNVGRGRTVDQEALADMLESGHLGGAVLDVFEEEPLDTNSRLWSLPNVIITPHISGKDEDPVNMDGIYGIFRKNLIRWFSGKQLEHIVDRKAGY